MVGGGGEQRTLRIAAKHADMTHWFAIGTEALMRKNEVLDATARRSGGTRARSSGRWARRSSSPLTRRKRPPSWSACPRTRRPFAKVGTPEQMAGAMRPYLDAGFTGFTFNNSLYRTPEQIARVGELLALVA
jgi:alkanesulfonate monooxygenase SsuD/methylene tetrahydromethanopterin reductase-like flavin-dependent oxidoreductase (luciferase family)